MSIECIQVQQLEVQDEGSKRSQDHLKLVEHQECNQTRERIICSGGKDVLLSSKKT